MGDEKSRDMGRAECLNAETFKIKQREIQQMALHKPDVSPGKESRKINKSVWIPPPPPILGSLTRYFLRPYVLLDHLHH